MIDELAVMNETLAYGLIGNSVPVATMGAFLRQAIEAVLKGLPAVEVASAEAREEAAVIQTKLDSSLTKRENFLDANPVCCVCG